MFPPIIIGLLISLPILLLLFRARPRPGPTLPLGPRPLPIIGNLHMLGRLPHRALADLAQKHGPIMSLRLGHVPTIVVSSSTAAELFLRQHDAVFASRPTVQSSKYMSYGAKGMAFAPYGEYWRRVRRMMTLHLLTPAKVASFEGLRTAEVAAATRRMEEAAAAREVVDVEERVGELIERMVFKMVVGKGKEEDKRYDLKGVVEEAMALSGAFNLADFVPYLAPFDFQGLTRKMKEISKRVDEILDKIIDDHLKEEDFTKQTDLLGAMLTLMRNPNDEFFSGSSFGRDNIKAIMLDIFVATIDTSYVSIVWVLSALIKHPRVMRLVQEELDSVVGKERRVLESDLPKLQFLDMVIKETFRLYPTGPLLIPHESMEDVIVSGYKIPKKSRIIFNYWAIGRDPNVWSENAEEFYPERFMGKDIDIRGRDFELIPFGAGRRGCPGMQLGLLTVKLVVAHFVHCFDWELPNGIQPEMLDMTEKFALAMSRANKLLAVPSHRLQVINS